MTNAPVEVEKSIRTAVESSDFDEKVLSPLHEMYFSYNGTVNIT